MGYDRYAAICQPLHYPILMSWRVCKQLISTCIVSGFLISLLGTTLVLASPSVAPTRSNYYFCDISPVIHLAHAGSDINELIFICGVLVLIVPLIFICISMDLLSLLSWGYHQLAASEKHSPPVPPISLWSSSTTAVCFFCLPETLSQIY